MEAQLFNVLEVSISYERQLVPDWFARHGGEAVLREDFLESRHKMCSVNTTLALEEYADQWKAWLASRRTVTELM